MVKDEFCSGQKTVVPYLLHSFHSAVITRGVSHVSCRAWFTCSLILLGIKILWVMYNKKSNFLLHKMLKLVWELWHSKDTSLYSLSFHIARNLFGITCHLEAVLILTTRTSLQSSMEFCAQHVLT